jgi:hypothetical protein
MKCASCGQETDNGESYTYFGGNSQSYSGVSSRDVIKVDGIEYKITGPFSNFICNGCVNKRRFPLILSAVVLLILPINALLILFQGSPLPGFPNAYNTNWGVLYLVGALIVIGPLFFWVVPKLLMVGDDLAIKNHRGPPYYSRYFHPEDVYK